MLRLPIQILRLVLIIQSVRLCLLWAVGHTNIGMMRLYKEVIVEYKERRWVGRVKSRQKSKES